MTIVNIVLLQIIYLGNVYNDLWLHKWHTAINLHLKHARYIIYNLIFSKTIYLSPVARLVCQNVLGGNTRRGYLYMYAHAAISGVKNRRFPKVWARASKNDFEKCKTFFFSRADTVHVTHLHHRTLLGIINATRKGI